MLSLARLPNSANIVVYSFFSATFAGECFRCTCFALPLGISRRTMPAAVPLACWVATIAVILGFIADGFSLSARREVGGGKLNSMLAGAAAFEAGCLHLLALMDGWLPGRDCKCSRSDFQQFCSIALAALITVAAPFSQPRKGIRTWELPWQA